DLKRVRNGVGWTADVERVSHDIDSAAAFDAGRLVGVDHPNRNAHPDGGAFAKPHEIDMDRYVPHRIDLEIARNHAMPGAVHVHIVKARQELARIDALAQFRMVERDVERGLIISIDDTGHAARATYGPGGPLAGPRTCRRVDLFDGRHFPVPRSA